MEGLFTPPDKNLGSEHGPSPVENWPERQKAALGRLASAGKRAGTAAVLNFTPAGDVDFLNDLRVKAQNGEEITMLDKILAASMAVPFIPAAVRRGGRKTQEFLRAMKGNDVKVKFPESEFDAGVRLDLQPSMAKPEELEEATAFMARADDLFKAEESVRKQGIQIPSNRIIQIAKEDPIIGPLVKDMNEVQTMDVIARARDQKRAGSLGGIDARVDGDALVIETTDSLPPMLRGKGYGTKMYAGLIGAAINRGLKSVESDAIVSYPAAKVYDRLANLGVQVKRNPAAYKTGTHWVTPERTGPVFRVDIDKPTMWGKPIDDLLTHKGEFEDLL